MLKKYNDKIEEIFDGALEFHVEFENICPFEDRNGSVGRLIRFKERCWGSIVRIWNC